MQTSATPLHHRLSPLQCKRRRYVLADRVAARSDTGADSRDDVPGATSERPHHRFHDRLAYPGGGSTPSRVSCAQHPSHGVVEEQRDTVGEGKKEVQPRHIADDAVGREETLDPARTVPHWAKLDS